MPSCVAICPPRVCWFALFCMLICPLLFCSVIRSEERLFNVFLITQPKAYSYMSGACAEPYLLRRPISTMINIQLSLSVKDWAGTTDDGQPISFKLIPFSIRLDSDRWYYWKYERDRTQFWPPPKSLRNFRRLREQKLVKLKCFFFLLCTVLRKLYDAYLFVRILTTCFYNDMAFTQKRVAMAPFKTHHCIASRG